MKRKSIKNVAQRGFELFGGGGSRLYRRARSPGRQDVRQVSLSAAH